MLILIALLVVFILLLRAFGLIITVGRDETALVALVQDVVSKYNAELVSPDPWTLWHVVYVARLNLFY